MDDVTVIYVHNNMDDVTVTDVHNNMDDVTVIYVHNNMDDVTDVHNNMDDLTVTDVHNITWAIFRRLRSIIIYFLTVKWRHYNITQSKTVDNLTTVFNLKYQPVYINQPIYQHHLSVSSLLSSGY
jgi:hypothetical protein